MITTPGGSYPVADSASLLRCYDETAPMVFAFLCRLVGGDRDVAEALLANVYIRIGDLPPGFAPAVADAHTLQAVCVAAAIEVAETRWGGDGSDVRERALLDLCVAGRRPATEVSTIVGLPPDVVEVQVDTLRRNIAATSADPATAAEQMLRGTEVWLDDDARSRTRLAIATGTPLRIDASGWRRGDRVAGWDNDSFSTSFRPREAPATAAAAEPRRSHRLKVGAVLGVVAVLLAGLLWVTPGGDDEDDGVGAFTSAAVDPSASSAPATTDAPATTERVTITTVDDDDTNGGQDAAPTTTESPFDGPRLELTPGFIIDNVPAGITPAALWEMVAEDSSFDYGNAWFQLWVEPEATRTSGRWLAMTTGRSIGWDPIVRASRATRIAGVNYSGVRWTTVDGSVDLTLRVGSDPVLVVDVQAFGLAESEVLSIVTTLQPFEMQLTAESFTVRESLFEPSSVGMQWLRGMEVTEARPISCCGYRMSAGRADERLISYGDETGNQWIEISTRDSVERLESDRFLDWPFPGFEPTSAPVVVQVGDRVVHLTAASLPGAPGYTLDFNTAWWTDRAQLVTVRTTLTADALLALVGSVRRAGEDEWLQLNEAAFVRSNEQSETVDAVEPVSSFVPPTTIGTVDLPGASRFRLQIHPATMSANVQVTSEMVFSGNEFGLPWAPTDVVSEFTASDATLLIISVADQPPGTSARVTVAGREPTMIDLVPLDRDADGPEGPTLSVGFDAFVELPPYTVELLDPTGAVVMVLTPGTPG